MGRYQELIGRQIYTVLALLFAVALSLSVSTELMAQTEKGLQMNMAGTDTSEVSAAAEEGVPERGQFQFVYSYSGEPIDPEINISVNGSQIVSLGSLGPTSNDTLVNRSVVKGDNIDMYVSFGIAEATIFLHTGLEGYTPGFWAGWGSITFYEFDPSDGSVIQVYGTMDYEYYHRPPWNGIEVTADPESISPGDSSSITLQPYETPAEPVIIPDVTYINLQTSFLGDLIGGLGLPEYGYRYVQGFNNAPWSLLKDTDIFYEVHPSIEASDNFEIPVVAYSPYDTGINGSTAIEVNKEEGLEIALDLLGSDEAWPTLESGDAHHSFNTSSVDNLIEDIVVTVTKSDGRPAPNQAVKIEANWVPESGGHSHTNPLPSKEKMGVLSISSTSKQGEGSVTAETNQEGKIYLSYTNPKFGGKIDLTASLQSATGQSDTEQVISKVPDLTPLPNRGIYKKVGGTNAHHGPPLYPSDDKNHYGTPSFVNAIIKIAGLWTQIPEIEEFDQKPLTINDMSLPNGGLFDIAGNWEPSHTFHRVGMDADVRTTRTLKSEGGRVGVYLTPTNVGRHVEYRNLLFERLWTKNGASQKPAVHAPGTDNEHYHVYYY